MKQGLGDFSGMRQIKAQKTLMQVKALCK